MFKDFKAFIMRGNVVDMAVGIIIGAGVNIPNSFQISRQVVPTYLFPFHPHHNRAPLAYGPSFMLYWYKQYLLAEIHLNPIAQGGLA